MRREKAYVKAIKILTPTRIKDGVPVWVSKKNGVKIATPLCEMGDHHLSNTIRHHHTFGTVGIQEYKWLRDSIKGGRVVRLDCDLGCGTSVPVVSGFLKKRMDHLDSLEQDAWIDLMIAEMKKRGLVPPQYKYKEM